MRYVAVSKARTMLPAIVESVERTILTKSGEPVAVVLQIDDYRALKAMQRLAADPARYAAVLEAHERVQRGELAGFVDLPLRQAVPTSRGSAKAGRARKSTGS